MPSLPNRSKSLLEVARHCAPALTAGKVSTQSALLLPVFVPPGCGDGGLLSLATGGEGLAIAAPLLSEPCSAE